jgi:putative PEP-CTERM system TPR-repeat lipoprotein
MFFNVKNKLLMSSIAFVLLVSACSDRTSPQEYIVSAKEQLKQGNTDEAIIYLKNLLKLNANDAEGRYLLGQAYVQQGDWFNAEKELNRANKYGFDKTQVVPSLAKVYFELGDSVGIESLLEQVKANSKEYISTKTYLAMSLTEDVDLVNATALFESIIATKVNSPYVLFSGAYIEGINKNNVLALQLIDKLLSQYPNFVEALSFKAKILFNDKQMKEAVIAFSSYLGKYKQDYKMRMRYALALVNNEQYDEAEKQASFLLKINKSNPLMNQIMAQTNFAKKDYLEAKTFAEKSINSGINLPLAKIIAGVSSYQLKQPEIAYEHLISVKNSLPYQHPARKLLNAIRFQLGYADETFSELNEAPINELDAHLLLNSAKELYKIGKTSDASILMAKASKLDPENADLIYQQGIMSLFNDDAGAIQLFKTALEKNPELDSAAVIMIIQLVTDSQFNEAMKVAQKLKETNTELGYSLIAGIYNNQGDITNATKYFEQVLLINDNNIGALFNLAKIEQLDNKFKKSFDLFQKILRLESNHIPTLIEVLKLAKQPSLKVEIEDLLQDNILSNDKEITAYLTLAEYYLINKETEKAHEAIEQGLLTTPESKKLLMAKIKIELLLKRYDLAMNSVNRTLEIDSDNAVAHAHKSQLLLLQDDLVGAIKEQEIAVTNAGTMLFKLQLANLYVKNNNVFLAKKIAQTLYKEYQLDINVLILQGNIAFLEQDYHKAADVFRRVNKVQPSDEVIWKLTTSLQNTGKVTQALHVIEEHEQKFADKKKLNINLRLKQAEMYSDGSPEKAITIYQGLLDSVNVPKYIVLNNLAWLYLKQEDKDKALSSAKAAIQLAANEPAIQDTFGVMLLEKGNKVEALSFLKKAFEANKAKQSYKLHYAQALIANNDNQQAKRLIEDLNSAYLKGDELDRYTKVMNIIK